MSGERLEPVSGERLEPAKLTEMRQWASEQRPDVRERVLTLCDAVEEASVAIDRASRALETMRRGTTQVLSAIEEMRGKRGKP